MAAAPPDVRHHVADTFRAVAQDVRLGVSTSRAAAASSSWANWSDFCRTLNVDESLESYDDPVPALQLYARQYRCGEASPSKRPVGSRTVEQALRTVGQTLASLGRPDPRLNPTGDIDFRLQRQLRAYSRQDPPPDRVKPIPLPVLQHTTALAYAAQTDRHAAVADMLILGFFFLLRPGEYAL